MGLFQAVLQQKWTRGSSQDAGWLQESALLSARLQQALFSLHWCTLADAQLRVKRSVSGPAIPSANQGLHRRTGAAGGWGEARRRNAAGDLFFLSRTGPARNSSSKIAARTVRDDSDDRHPGGSLSKSSGDDTVGVKVADSSSPVETKRRRLRTTFPDLHLFVLQDGQLGFARSSQCCPCSFYRPAKSRNLRVRAFSLPSGPLLHIIQSNSDR